MGYTSVYIFRSRSSIRGTPAFLFRFLSDVAENSTTRYHDAVSPDLEFVNNGWTVKDGTTGPIWTESNWPNGISSRAFFQEGDDVATAMLVFGAVLIVATAAILHFLVPVCDRKFKTV